ncbi:hypothetical protein WMF12_34855 [Sorangium sp. So ce363]
MRLGQPLARLQHVPHGDLDRRRPVRPQQRAEIAALEQLEDQEWIPGVEEAQIEDAGDMLAAQRRRRPPLAQEALPRRGVDQRVSAQQLERDLVPEVQVAGGHHHAHPALAEQALDAVSAGDDVSEAHRGAHGLRGARV